MRVGLKDEARQAQPARYALVQQALRQIHGVGDGEHSEARCGPLRPVEEVVEDLLSTRAQKVQLRKKARVDRLQKRGLPEKS